MFHTDKQVIKERIFVVLISSLLIWSSCTFAAEEVSVTPIALKAMQTRLFNKHSGEVINAINTNCADIDGTGSVQPIRKIGKNVLGGTGTCTMKFKPPETSLLNFIPILGAVKSMQDTDDMLKSLTRINYEITETPDGKGTLVRMRAYSANSTQINNAEFYAKEFKNLGDAIFTEGLQITPATQE